MESIKIEYHPLTPFLPEGCKVLMLGSFPPAQKRWCMDFFYPNFSNDMWRIMGIIFRNDKMAFVDSDRKTFRKEAIKRLLREKGIGIYDTAKAVRRLKNTASDKDLEVVEAVNLSDLLNKIPLCRTIITTGQKATDLCCEHFSIHKQPAVGTCVTFKYNETDYQLYRLPSSSRAYPMAIDGKAAIYSKAFHKILE